MDHRATEGLCDAGYLTVPKEEHIEIIYDREDVNNYIVPKEEKFNPSLALDIADFHQPNTNTVTPIKTERVLCKDIVELQKTLKHSEDGGISKRIVDVEITVEPDAVASVAGGSSTHTMPYKIVQTIEKGRFVLTSIPDTWEKDGILLWPRNVQSGRLKTNENYYPQDDWVKSNCIVKRRNLLSYDEAEKEIENMCNNSNTELFARTENEEASPPKQKKRHHGMQPTQYFHNEDFNSLAQSCLLDKTDHQPAIDGIYYTPEPMQEENPNLTTEKIDNICTQIPLILKNQKHLIANQQIMIMKIHKISTIFDEFVKQLNMSTITKESSEQIDFNIISCSEDAEKLESKLKDEEYRMKLKNKFSVVCGKGKGFNNAYVLIDLIFTREFINQCSWAGGSRKGKPKICFRAYTRIFDFFFDLINMTDNTFTKEDCKTFLKNILRNSESRKNRKQMRASSSRNRPKSMKLNKLETKVTPDEASTANKQSLSEEAQKRDSSNEESLC